MTKPILIYIDADACPVKEETYRVAARHRIKVFLVANAFIAVPRDVEVERVIVPAGLDVADDWIAERVEEGDLVITADVPLAARVVARGAEAIGPTGKPFTASSIGMQLATRNLMADLREAGEITRGPRPFSPRDRSEFLQSLDRAIQRLKRKGFLAG
ncbi:YaiI/YqxD family protein [Ancylobacter sp. TS-1]|uniref:YaiI/YqxD family protein n=1 Tax=Ancylobacter sp. TS-1 TaxID=1850374 RepID=UPI001265C2D3|nr:YaiI/YqxD family protein [Ancylobacter sp. TS-1]QFR32875.1 YaiI/YqxD family protein [Ancylobacter sp. TS-1]